MIKKKKQQQTFILSPKIQSDFYWGAKIMYSWLPLQNMLFVFSGSEFIDNIYNLYISTKYQHATLQYNHY